MSAPCPRASLFSLAAVIFQHVMIAQIYCIVIINSIILSGATSTWVHANMRLFSSHFLVLFLVMFLLSLGATRRGIGCVAGGILGGREPSMAFRSVGDKGRQMGLLIAQLCSHGDPAVLRVVTISFRAFLLANNDGHWTSCSSHLVIVIHN